MQLRDAALLIFALLVSTLTSTTPALATFHKWEIQEVFSNADGTIQFIELFTEDDDQEMLMNLPLLVRGSSGVINQYIFSTSLAPGTAGRSFLLGTQGLADLAGGVTADYIIPAGFIDLNSAEFLDFVDVDTFALAGLPTNGLDSLGRNGLSNVATPLNYAGETGVVPEPSSGLLLVTGLIGLASRQMGRA